MKITTATDPSVGSVAMADAKALRWLNDVEPWAELEDSGPSTASVA